MNNTITNEELEAITINLIKNNDKKEAKRLITIYHKLISNYKYYKNLASELQTKIDN